MGGVAVYGLSPLETSRDLDRVTPGKQAWHTNFGSLAGSWVLIFPEVLAVAATLAAGDYGCGRECGRDWDSVCRNMSGWDWRVRGFRIRVCELLVNDEMSRSRPDVAGAC